MVKETKRIVLKLFDGLGVVHRMSLCHSGGTLQFSNLCFCVSVVFFSALDGGRFIFILRRLVIQQWAWQVVVGGIVL